MIGRLLRTSLVAALLLLGCCTASAHEVRPAYLSLTQVDADVWEVLWKTPARGEVLVQLQPGLPAQCSEIGPRSLQALAGADLARWRIRCPDGLMGARLAVEGLDNSLVDALVRIEFADGGSESAILRGADHALVVGQRRGPAAAGYVFLGIDHILLGVDHLLFVLCLLLLVRNWRSLVLTITAFTLAHSITLGLAALDLVRVSSAPVEAVIALSILLLALELARREHGRSPGLAQRSPWLVAFGFGLLHGFGFAGALTDIGLPRNDVPLALLSFNVGVELGQLGFVLAVLLVLALTGRRELREPLPWEAAIVYSVGGLSAYWVLQRSAAIVGLA